MKLLKENYNYDERYEEKISEDELKREADEAGEEDQYWRYHSKWHSAYSDEYIEEAVLECLDPIWRRRSAYWRQRGIKKTNFEGLLRSFYKYTLDSSIMGNCYREDGWCWKSSTHAIKKWGLDNGLKGREIDRFFLHVDSFDTYS